MAFVDWRECVYCSGEIRPGDGELKKRFDSDSEKSPFHFWCLDLWNSPRAFEKIGPDDE